jgi:hypothetical protein
MITDCFEANNRIVRWVQEKVYGCSAGKKKNVQVHFFRAAALVEYDYQIACCINRKHTSSFFCQIGRFTYGGIGTTRICKELRLLSSHRKGTLVKLRMAINKSRLRANIACCAVAFASFSYIFILIGKQIVYRLTVADYQVPI